MLSTPACAFLPRSAMSKTRKVSPARNAIKAKYASLMPHSRRFPEQECTKRVSVPRAQLEPMTWQAPPRAHPVHPRLFGHSERIATTSASNELLGDELAALMPAAIGQLCAYLFKHNVHSRLDGSLNSTPPGSIVRCRKSCRIFRGRMAVKQPMVVQFR